MEIYFGYEKPLVIQALRYHFIKRPEIRVLMILVNVFAIFAAFMFYSKKVSPVAFLLSSLLWLGLMAAFWFILPNAVYKKAATFRDTFKMIFSDQLVRIENARGGMEWSWNKFSNWFESPHFVHLYFDSRSFFLVPKAAIIGSADINDLRTMLNKKILKR